MLRPASREGLPAAAYSPRVTGVRAPGMRSSLGTSGTGPSVNLDAIPFLEGDYEIQGPDKIAMIGDAPKDYIVFKTRGVERAYIAKKPRMEGPIECVTEYLISLIGKSLPLRVAEGSLFQLPRKPGQPPDVRFLSRQFLDRAAGEQLVHGSQLVARCFEMKEEELTKQLERGKEWSFYTIDLLDEVFRSTATGADAERLCAGFARMMAFDAIVGANDRHPQNWGVVENAVQAAARRFSPIFDTARGLFWNHSEQQLEAKDSTGRQAEIERYARRSAPLIGLVGPESQPNHFDVTEALVKRGEPYRTPIRQVVTAFNPDRVTRMLHKEFRRLLSRRRLEYIDGLLRYRHSALKRVCGLS